MSHIRYMRKWVASDPSVGRYFQIPHGSYRKHKGMRKKSVFEAMFNKCREMIINNGTIGK